MAERSNKTKVETRIEDKRKTSIIGKEKRKRKRLRKNEIIIETNKNLRTNIALQSTLPDLTFDTNVPLCKH